MEAAFMRGFAYPQDGMFSYLSPADRVTPDHPLRPIKQMVNQALTDLGGEFQAMSARVEGRRRTCPAADEGNGVLGSEKFLSE
jgi:hypothetical protein